MLNLDPERPFWERKAFIKYENLVPKLAEGVNRRIILRHTYCRFAWHYFRHCIFEVAKHSAVGNHSAITIKGVLLRLIDLFVDEDITATVVTTNYGDARYTIWLGERRYSFMLFSLPDYLPCSNSIQSG